MSTGCWTLDVASKIVWIKLVNKGYICLYLGPLYFFWYLERPNEKLILRLDYQIREVS